MGAAAAAAAAAGGDSSDESDVDGGSDGEDSDDVDVEPLFGRDSDSDEHEPEQQVAAPAAAAAAAPHSGGDLGCTCSDFYFTFTCPGELRALILPLWHLWVALGAPCGSLKNNRGNFF